MNKPDLNIELNDSVLRQWCYDALEQKGLHEPGQRRLPTASLEQLVWLLLTDPLSPDYVAPNPDSVWVSMPHRYQ